MPISKDLRPAQPRPPITPYIQLPSLAQPLRSGGVRLGLAAFCFQNTLLLFFP
ncbi:hypothetical protein B0O99DRAFT_620712 [Bisporella sp. PMI_857]|nr:hypothetical protein B0O99DRAFT_620712 [Bisporella sp. PMI_857]